MRTAEHDSGIFASRSGAGEEAEETAGGEGKGAASAPAPLSASILVTTILDEFSAIGDYRLLQDSLPRRLASLLRSRYVLLYKRIGETLQFVSGTFDDRPGWSTSLLAVAQINPIDLNSERPEARAWRLRRVATAPADPGGPQLVAVPLIYRQRATGVLVAIRDGHEGQPEAGGQAAGLPGSRLPAYWAEEEIQVLEAVAGVSAMLLENTLLLERDRERIHELSLLNSIGSQINSAVHDLERLCTIIMQRSREIAPLDLCDILLSPPMGRQAPWISPALSEALFRYAREQGGHPTPLLIERPGSPRTADYLSHLPASINTFIALPLISGGDPGRRGRLYGPEEREPRVLGLLVGGTYRPWKVRHVELMMLQVLASQASAALENIHLMTEVIEARNEARKLLRQVLDDQRLKELILESIPSGLMTIDLSGQITTFNRAASLILGYHPYEALGQPVHKILPLKNPQALPGEALQSGGGQRSPSAYHETLITHDRQGQDLVLDMTWQPLCNDRGRQIGTLLTFSDVTSMHRLQEEKRRLDELASLGKMAASVAHEVRNPLASIKITMQMLMDDLERLIRSEASEAGTGDQGDRAQPPLDEHRGAQESIAVVLKEVERLDNIVRELLLFAKPRQLHRVPCDLIALNEHVLQTLQPCLTEAGIVVHRVYQRDLLEQPQRQQVVVLADMEQMEQVLFNLYTNAIQAMPEGGILTISAQVVQRPRSGVGAGYVLPRVHVAESQSGYLAQETQRWLELSISDTGIGIPPEQLDLIFQPFFTTKAHGIGLGLAITQRLIESHQGQISVESRLGYGATFTVRLPLAPVDDSPESESGAESRTTEPTSGRAQTS
ncbi:ATP-binding protein [Thermogemmatispora carboxidivorans]|uniref:ATP-binding protein n=1 Tax=Thermogemmatispora carboxidivorans TaxID=1382306 RepID=UPI00069C75E8|nr:ATP-binding protein [Thermogemmatispora carboxidivorans]